jgi:hypothetical protein
MLKYVPGACKTLRSIPSTTLKKTVNVLLYYGQYFYFKYNNLELRRLSAKRDMKMIN